MAKKATPEQIGKMEAALKTKFKKAEKIRKETKTALRDALSLLKKDDT